MIVAWMPIVGMLVGALVYALSTNAKAAELGRALFWASTIALMLTLAHATVRLG